MKTSKLYSVLAGLCALAAAFQLAAQEPTPLVTKSEADNLAVLKSSAELKAKLDACRELSVIGTKAAIPTLVEFLADEKLSHMARYALETMPDAAVSEALRAQLTQVKGRLLTGVIGSLGVRRDLQATPGLVSLLGSDDNLVVQAAARALGSLGTREAAEALYGAFNSGEEENFTALCEGLARCAERLTREGQPELALWIYGQAYENAELPQQIRVASLRGAIVSRGPDGLALLREQLRSPDYILFAATVKTALELKGPEVTTALAESLKSLAPDNQVVVLQALATRAEVSALPAMAAAIESSNAAVRLAAARALAAISSADAVPVLVKAATGADRELAQVAKESLAALDHKAVDETATKLLASASAEERLAGVELIGRRRIASSVPALVKATADSDPRVRVAAIRQVGELGGVSELQTVLDLMLRAASGQERNAAEQALVSIAGGASDAESVSGKIAAAVPQAQPEARSSLLSVLGSLGGPTALKAVSAAAKDSSAEVRAEAIRALSSWKTADAAPALQGLASSASSDGDKTLALRGFLGLAANPDLPVEQRYKMCQDAVSLVKRTEEKRLLLAALGTVPTPDAVKLIVPHLNDPATKEEAGAAVVAIADRMLRGQGANPAAAVLVEPLTKVAQTSGNADLVKRAKDLAQRAKTRSGQ